MATPILNGEILKLRRKLGDIYDSSGNLVVDNSGSPPAGQIHVGNASLVSTWTAAELLDCYNDAVRYFIDYLARLMPEEIINYAPAFLVNQSFVPSASSTIQGKTIYYKNLADITALPPARILSIAVEVSGLSDEQELARYCPINEVFATATKVVKTRSTGKQLEWSMWYDHGLGMTIIAILNAGSAPSGGNILYVKRHTSYTYDHASIDATEFTDMGLKRVLLLAESLAQRYRSTEVRDLSDAEIQQATQLDVLSQQIRR